MENAEVTKTLLCFMVKSLCCEYEDVVAMVPLPVINSFVIKKWYDNVLQVLVKVGKPGAGAKSSFSCSIVVASSLPLKAELFDDDYIQELFLASSFPKAVLVNILTKKISNTSASDSIFGQVCNSYHSFQAFVPSIAAKFFNCMSKNFVQSVIDKIHAGRNRGNVK
ncbi:Putative LOC101234274 [Caligus rogercresseyi]|uniref:LOC101234274 n=1 Tax=Caligus rogercresseyi TaxID=217165 RepID=A0A7T8HL30_CALRO|nr:Putative LOC101234274 [Caligus rogercresseyi]